MSYKMDKYKKGLASDVKEGMTVQLVSFRAAHLYGKEKGAKRYRSRSLVEPLVLKKDLLVKEVMEKDDRVFLILERNLMQEVTATLKKNDKIMTPNTKSLD